LINHAGASITSPDDAIRINADLPHGVVVIDNAGSIRSTTSGQAVDFNNIVAGTVSTTITNETGGVIEAAGADAIRPGTNAAINNHGRITADGSGSNDGIDFQDVGFGSVHNFQDGSITGARHGITGKLPITVDNDAGASILGQHGSGINLDTASNTTTVINNSGTITGTAGGTQDGDGIDVDGLITLNNHGRVEGLGTWSGGLSEALTIGGGTINNFAGGVIHSVQRAITVDDSNLGNAFAVTVIYNEGTIQGDSGEAISITSVFADTLTNKGTILGTVALGDGNDVVEDYAGATFSADISGGAGSDIINLRGTGPGNLGSFSAFETVNVFSGDWTIASEGFALADLEAGAQTLRLAAGTVADGHFNATISGFDSDDLLDLEGIGTATLATLGAGNILTVTGGSVGPVTLQLDPAHDYTHQGFKVAADGGGGTLVTISPADLAPVFTSPASFSVPENQSAVGTVAATDPEHDAFTFMLAGGSDDEFFVIDAHTGALSFAHSPDFETSQDANHDNVYDLTVAATDVFGASTSQTLHVTVTNVAETGQSFNGGNGNDNLTGTTGNDVMNGGNGNDRLDGGDGNDSIAGGNGNDILIGGRGDDVLDGGNGDDSLDGGLGNDHLVGGNGNDNLNAGDGNNALQGGNGNDVLVAGSGNDNLSGDDGNDYLNAGEGNNVLQGGNGNDVLMAGAGDDNLSGGDGNDSLNAGAGNNILDGGNGNDVLTAGAGNDSLNGGSGNDSLFAGGGDDVITGGNGSDLIVFASGFGHDVVTDFSHGDHIEFDGGVFQNFQAVQSASHQVGSDTVITLDAGNSIVLQHVTVNSLHASDFLFA